MSVDLENFSIGYSVLSKRIYLYRYGEAHRAVLDKRDASQEIMWAIVSMMMEDAPKGASQSVRFDENCYRVAVEPITRAEFDRDRNGTTTP